MANIEKQRLPIGWVLTSVERVGSVRTGLQRSPERHSGQYPTKYIRTANITPRGIDLSNVQEMAFSSNERQLYALQAGDVLLMEASGSASQVGRSAIWRGEIPLCCFQNHVIRFRPHLTTPEFANTVFRHYMAEGTFAAVSRGIGIQHLGSRRFAQLPFPLPPLAEQSRIDAEVSRRTAAVRQAETALHSALSRVDEQNAEIIAAAVEGRLVEQEAAISRRLQTTFEPATQLLERVLALPDSQRLLFKAGTRTRRTDRTVRPPLPEGWVWARTGDVGDVRLGKGLDSNDSRGDMWPYLRVANVLEDAIDVGDVKMMRFTPAEREVYELRAGDILLNEGQSIALVGRPAMFKSEIPSACFQNSLIRFRSGPAVIRDYALFVFRHYLHSGQFQRVARRSTNIAHLGRERFANLSFPLPPLKEQQRIAVEAQRRLTAARVQRTAVLASLERLPQLEREFLALAIAGSLAPQDPSDEPAEVTLERMGSPPLLPSVVLEDTHGVPAVTTRTFEQADGASKATLSSILASAGRPLRIPELFSMAKYDRDSTEDIERFYLKLRAELGATIRAVDDSGDNALLEVITDAPR